MQSTVWNLALSPDGQTVATASGDGTVKLWNLADGKERLTLRHPPHARGVAFSPDGKRLATGNLSGSIKLWNVTDGKELASLEGHKDLVFFVRFSSDGKTLFSASKDETARVWQVPAPAPSPEMRASREKS